MSATHDTCCRVPIIPRTKPMGRAIAEKIAARHGLTRVEMLGPSRRRREAWPRQEAYWTIRRDTDLSYPQIARIFGRDHTTVLHGVREHEKRIGGGA